MSDQSDRDFARYARAAHAMQSAVALAMSLPGLRDEIEPKHLRVGINAAMSEHSALARLLVEKGVITEEEYAKAIADAMEAEVEIYRRQMNLPPSVTFG